MMHFPPYGRPWPGSNRGPGGGVGDSAFGGGHELGQQRVQAFVAAVADAQGALEGRTVELTTFDQKLADGGFEVVLIFGLGLHVCRKVDQVNARIAWILPDFGGAPPEKVESAAGGAFPGANPALHLRAGPVALQDRGNASIITPI